jgi:hypothetical protein
MTDWDKVFAANKEAGNWYPPEPISEFDRVLLMLLKFVGGVFALAMLAMLAGYLWERLT